MKSSLLCAVATRNVVEQLYQLLQMLQLTLMDWQTLKETLEAHHQLPYSFQLRAAAEPAPAEIERSLKSLMTADLT